MFTKRILPILPLYLALGCNAAVESGSEGRETSSVPANAKPEPATEPEPYLGLPDDRSRKVGDESPDSALANIEIMTKVQEVTYATFQEKKKAQLIRSEERRGRFVYFAVELIRHVPFPNGSSASISVVERYKAPVPGAD
jgi:hypothetical protein